MPGYFCTNHLSLPISHLIEVECGGAASNPRLDRGAASLSSSRMRQILLQMSSSLSRPVPGLGLSRLRVEYVLAILSGLALVVLCTSVFGDVGGVIVACGLFSGGAVVVAIAMHRLYPHEEFGICNLITMTRLALTVSLVPILFAAENVRAAELWAAFAIAVFALSLDGVDGWAARRAGLASRFGARFDMEVDSVFALTLALIAYQTGQAGVWVLLLGLPRYAFWVSGLIWPRLQRELPDTLVRKAVCVFQIGTLTAFLVPILPGVVLTSAAVLSAVALAWSFSTDVHALLADAE
ncbi:MAG: CDP-alcohol phosphatidyltransferase family protein [Pseudomonadota bacterium]